MSADPVAVATQLASPGTGDGVLRFDAVSKTYGQVSALMDVTFAVRPEVVGLVGRNGAGKSTLMKLACGLLSPSQGLVTVCGEQATRPSARRLFGFCPDIEQLPSHLTGRQFVAAMLRLHGVGARAAHVRAGAVLDELGLGANMERAIGTYSKGMRQRVRLGQALAHSPRVVLLDEPMNGLDPVARHELTEQIERLARSGVAVVVSSHVLHELEAMVDRVLLMHQGRLLAEGAVQELRNQLEGKPHRMLVRSRNPRVLARELAGLPQVAGLQVREDSVEVSIAGQAGFYRELTGIGARAEGIVEEMVPVDDSLASLFGYLVG
ncbi:MAG: putative transporter ATP-binding protein YxlF [Planctomycetota bacterium]|jgi:ABC-2 type transport system ATP-binding protein